MKDKLQEMIKLNLWILNCYAFQVVIWNKFIIISDLKSFTTLSDVRKWERHKAIFANSTTKLFESSTLK